MKAPAKTETGTGTTTASRPDVVGAAVRVVVAGEAAAAAGTKTEGTDVAAHATDPLRYENHHLPFPLLSYLYHQIEWDFITGV